MIVIRHTSQVLIQPTTTISNTTRQNNVDNKCPEGDGYYVLPGCIGYYYCVFSGTSSQLAIHIPCPQNTLFYINIKSCNWPKKTKCKMSSIFSMLKKFI